MSFKAKDLAYSQNEPAFLRRIRGEIRGSVDDPDRQINPVARPTISQRLKKDEADEDPTYVLEETNQNLSKEEYEALLNQEEAAAAEKKSDISDTAVDMSKESPTTSIRPKENVAEVGRLLKKRKVARVVGQDDEDETELSKSQAGKLNNKSSKIADQDVRKPPRKKRPQAVKLSFGVDESEP
jgi:hypothetical protein